MARKRYETAFLPSGGIYPSGLRLPSPDADTLLLAVEQMSPQIHNCATSSSTKSSISKSGFYSRSFEMDACSGTQAVHNRPNLSLSKELHSISNSGIEPPLSVPLRTKRYTLQACYSEEVNANDEQTVNVTKGASISSLESLDSAQSEDYNLKSRNGSFRRQNPPFRIDKTLAYKQHEKVTAVSTLSPIADKSPLDPLPAFQQISKPVSVPYHSERSVDSDSGLRNSDGTVNLLSAYELTNVPWEMPKLRRKLARLVDSGISLDATPPSNRHHQNLDFCYSYANANSAPETEINNGSADSLLNFQLQQGSQQFDRCANDQYEKRCNLDLKIPRVTANTCGFPPPKTAEGLNRPGDGGEGVGESELGGEMPEVETGYGGHVYLDFEEPALRASHDIPFDPDLELEFQDWFFGAINRPEAEHILRRTVEGTFLVRNCESYNFNKYSLSLKCSRGIMHIRIEPNSYGTYSLGDQEFSSVSRLILHFMHNRLPIKGAEHVKLMYPIMQKLL